MFIKKSFREVCQSNVDSLKVSKREFNTLNKHPVVVKGVAKMSIRLDLCPNKGFYINLNVLEKNNIMYIIISGDILSYG